MRAAKWKTCWWPGLKALWHQGRWDGLAIAMAFGLAVQLALLRTFAPAAIPNFLAATVSPLVAWTCVLSLWVMGVWFGSREETPAAAVQDPQIDQWLREAQAEYLKGHWIEAEAVLWRLLARQPDDVEGLLLLASIQRRTRQRDKAGKTLKQLAEHQRAVRWGWEIRIEEQRIVESQRRDAKGETGASQQASRAA